MGGDGGASCSFSACEDAGVVTESGESGEGERGSGGGRYTILRLAH